MNTRSGALGDMVVVGAMIFATYFPSLFPTNLFLLLTFYLGAPFIFPFQSRFFYFSFLFKKLFCWCF